ncbi:GNAT family N-acetyltransferase [Neobacillus drentensis]|uniref:GNAT family N-acetyltransferase n=1 Tax=Neobacillus drentensis TaxID=220684 RepID=UPI002FFF816C
MIRRSHGDETQHPTVILHNGAPVGFFVLRSGEVVKDFSANPRALLLVAMCVSHAHQGKGYAGKGLRQLQAFVSEQFRDRNEVVLAVNEHNVGAIHLYKKVGFEDTGERKVGRLGTTLVFSLFCGEAEG